MLSSRDAQYMYGPDRVHLHLEWEIGQGSSIHNRLGAKEQPHSFQHMPIADGSLQNTVQHSSVGMAC